MRKGSLIGPFLLIGIGAILLINNLRPELSLFEMAVAYWPVLLIVWGGLRLVEILVAAGRNRPLPQAGITGGEWTLVVFLCLIGSGTNFARSNWPHARISMHGLEIFGEAYDYQVSGEQEAGETPRVFIENLRGNVRVNGGDSQTIQVEGRTTVRAFEQSDADEANAKCPLEVVRQGDEIIVRTNQDRLGANWKMTTDLDITVPKGASIEGRGREGDFDITNVLGNVEINSDNAGVRLTEIGGNARVELRRSDIIRIRNLKGMVDLGGRGQDIELENIEGRVAVKGSYSGELVMRNLMQPLLFESKRTELRVERTPGEIRMDLGDVTAENLVGPVLFKTTSRDVRITDFTERLDLDIDRGDIDLRFGSTLSPVTVGVRNGDITVAVPESGSFGLEAVTERGEAVNEYGSGVATEMVGDRGARMSTPDAQSPTIKLKTGRGDVTIRRSSGGSDGAAPKRLQTDSA